MLRHNRKQLPQHQRAHEPRPLRQRAMSLIISRQDVDEDVRRQQQDEDQHIDGHRVRARDVRIPALARQPIRVAHGAGHLRLEVLQRLLLVPRRLAALVRPAVVDEVAARVAGAAHGRDQVQERHEHVRDDGERVGGVAKAVDLHSARLVELVAAIDDLHDGCEGLEDAVVGCDLVVVLALVEDGLHAEAGGHGGDDEVVAAGVAADDAVAAAGGPVAFAEGVGEAQDGDGVLAVDVEVVG